MAKSEVEAFAIIFCGIAWAIFYVTIDNILPNTPDNEKNNDNTICLERDYGFTKEYNCMNKYEYDKYNRNLAYGIFYLLSFICVSVAGWIICVKIKNLLFKSTNNTN